MHKELLVNGLAYYEIFKNSKQSELNNLEFRTWLASSISWLEIRVSKSELYKVVQSIRIFESKPSEISFNQIEMFMALLQAQGNIADEEIKNAEAIYDLNY